MGTPLLAIISKLKSGLVIVLHTMLTISAFYCLWGWMTFSDIRKICTQKNLDYEEVVSAMVPQLSIKISDKEGTERLRFNSEPPGAATNIPGQVEPTHQVAGITIKRLNEDTSFSRYLIPFTLGSGKDESIFIGGLLEPWVGLSENTANALTAFSFGFLISILIVGIEYLKGDERVKLKRVLMRPVLGALSAMLVYLIILSGGSIIWNQAAGVSGLSLGVIASIGALFCEKFEAISSITT